MRRLLLALTAVMSTSALAQTTIITGGTVVIGDGSAPIERGTVVFSGGRVVAVGRTITVPAGATVIDASGKWVTPGIVAGFSRIGLVGVDAVVITVCSLPSIGQLSVITPAPTVR